jgi:hypothetical protein
VAQSKKMVVGKKPGEKPEECAVIPGQEATL